MSLSHKHTILYCLVLSLCLSLSLSVPSCHKISNFLRCHYPINTLYCIVWCCLSVCLSVSLYPVVTKYPTLYDMSLSHKHTILYCLVLPVCLSLSLCTQLSQNIQLFTMSLSHKHTILYSQQKLENLQFVL